MGLIIGRTIAVLIVVLILALFFWLDKVRFCL